MISERPAEAENLAIPEHWEGDLIIGLDSSAIGTLVERTTRFTMLLHLPRMAERGRLRVKNGPALAGHGAEAVRDAITSTIATLPDQLRRSLTWDQGAEMAQHAQLRIDTGLHGFFCDPRSPWQRGTNENTNVIRASVPERVAMLLTGHKSRAIFDRYNIINEQELLDAGDQLVAYLAQQAQAGPARRRPHAASPAAPALRLVRTHHRVRAAGAGHRPSVRRRSRPGHRVRVGPRSRRRGGPTRPTPGTHLARPRLHTGPETAGLYPRTVGSQASRPSAPFAPQFQHWPSWPSLTSWQLGHVQPGGAGPAGARASATSRFASSTFDRSTTHNSGHVSVGGSSPAAPDRYSPWM